MPALRSLLGRATSHCHMSQHKLLHDDDDFSDDESLGKQLLKSTTTTKRTGSDGSCTEISTDSLDESNPAEFEQLGHSSFPAKRHTNNKPLTPSTPQPEKQTLGSFLDRDRANTSTSTSRAVLDRHGRASKGRSRRVSGNRSVASMPATTRSCSKSVSAPSSPVKSLREPLSGKSYHSSPRKKPSTPLSCPASAPTCRKQKVVLRSLPRTPPLGPNELYRKAKSTRDLLKEYNNILDEFDDSARGPRSNTVDLLEEYDQILTEYDDSARADRNTPYTTGWR